jgi:hypothetical protein
MKESTRRTLVLATTAVGSFCAGSVCMNRVMNSNLRARNMVLVNGFRKIQETMTGPNVNPQKVVQTMGEELEFIMIALRAD